MIWNWLRRSTDLFSNTDPSFLYIVTDGSRRTAGLISIMSSVNTRGSAEVLDSWTRSRHQFGLEGTAESWWAADDRTVRSSAADLDEENVSMDVEGILLTLTELTQWFCVLETHDVVMKVDDPVLPWCLWALEAGRSLIFSAVPGELLLHRRAQPSVHAGSTSVLFAVSYKQNQRETPEITERWRKEKVKNRKIQTFINPSAVFWQILSILLFMMDI